MKTQFLILLTKLKLNSLKMASIVFSFFLPISGILILIAFAILLDTITGIYKSIKLKQKVTSRGLSQIISKIMLYETTILLFFLIDKFLVSEIVAQFFSIEYLVTKVFSLVLVTIEVVSINENYKAIYGKDLYSTLKLMFRRAKEITSEYKNIDEDNK
jgi:hypothetical protein